MNDSAPFEPFPHYVDARKVFSQKGNFSGELGKEKFDRLPSLLVEGVFSVTAELRFAIGDRGRRMIEGNVDAQVSVACQRCLKPLELTLADDIRLALVQDEEAAEKLRTANNSCHGFHVYRMYGETQGGERCCCRIARVNQAFANKPGQR